MQPAQSVREDMYCPQHGAFFTLSYGEIKPLDVGLALHQTLLSTGSITPQVLCTGNGDGHVQFWIPLTISIFLANQDLRMFLLNYNQAV